MIAAPLQCNIYLTKVLYLTENRAFSSVTYGFFHSLLIAFAAMPNFDARIAVCEANRLKTPFGLPADFPDLSHQFFERHTHYRNQ